MIDVLDRGQIIAAAQGGDPSALGQLLLMSQRDARRYARQHCFAADVDDAVQETLLILSRKVNGLKAAVAFSSWIFTIVRRECRRLARKIRGRGPSLDEIAEFELAHRPDESLRLDIFRALESLPAHYLQVILLRDFGEMTIAEIAQETGLQTPGVKSRLHRARELVREYLMDGHATLR